MELLIQLLITFAVLGPVLAVSQNNRRAMPRQQQQFTNRFNPNEKEPKGQQGNYQQQQQQEQRVNHFPPLSDINREITTFIPIIRFDKQQSVDGGYKTLWETGNNIVAEETGVLKSFHSGEKEEDNLDAVVQHGSYSYTSPEGQIITVQYTADERGFRATGDHIPTPPPIPVEIQKSLDVIYASIAQQQRLGGGTQQDDRQNNQQQQQQPFHQLQDTINFRFTSNRNVNKSFRQ